MNRKLVSKKDKSKSAPFYGADFNKYWTKLTTCDEMTYIDVYKEFYYWVSSNGIKNHLSGLSITPGTNDVNDRYRGTWLHHVVYNTDPTTNMKFCLAILIACGIDPTVEDNEKNRFRFICESTNLGHIIIQTYRIVDALKNMIIV